MERVKLPREVVLALDFARNQLDWTDGNILTRSVRGDWESIEMNALSGFIRTDNDRMTIAKALVIGYEIEQTPEDKVRSIYREWADKQTKSYKARDVEVHKSSTMFLRGMLTTLEALEIKYEGVNLYEQYEGESDE